MHAVDVIVVGGGGSGLAAAVSAAEEGRNVLLLEKCASLGGTTGIAIGSFTANRTRLQERQGLSDGIDAHAEDVAQFAPPEIEARNHHEPRRHFLEHAADTLNWLMEMGLVFHGPSPEPPNRVPRMHNVVPNAKAYIAVLQGRLLRLDGDIWTSTSVERLLLVDGRVRGVRLKRGGIPQDVHARLGVILATGDYANNARLIADYKGEQFQTIEGINPHATGDGHLMARQLGAPLVNMDVAYGPELRFIPPPRQPFAQLLPATGPFAKLTGMLLPWIPKAVLARFIKRLLVTWQHPENRLFDDGAILINQNGERFCDEKKSPDREIAVSRQPNKLAYILLDQSLTDRYSRWPHFISTAPEIAYAYVQDYLRLRPDITVSSESLEQIANARGISSDNLRGTVIADGTQRWTLLGPVKAYFTTTEGGLSCDREFRVLREGGEPIEGLYAVGQVGLSGQILWGHGLHIAWAMTSGRLAGKVVAKVNPHSVRP